MKKRIFAAGFILALACASSAYADGGTAATYSESGLTYYGAVLNGHVADSGTDSSYGFDLWGTELDNEKLTVGTGSYSGDISCNVLLCADTEYYYRAFIKNGSSGYIYGEMKSFKTPASPADDDTEVSFDIGVEALEDIDLAETPNKFFLNNLILNERDTLRLVAGDNFDGINGIEGVAGENIFINRYFMNKYNTDPVLRSLLTIFDGAVYNRDDFLWDAATSIVVPDFVAKGIYNISPDSLKSTLNTIYGDMGVKRFNGAINNVIRNDYESTDRRTFGFDKAHYNIIDAFSTSTDTVKEMVQNFQDGKDTLVEGIEDYQGYYYGTVIPKYRSAQSNFSSAYQYLYTNYKSMSDAEKTQYKGYISEYSQEMSACENLDFAYETASKWKIGIETNYYAKGVFDALEKVGKPLSMTSSSLGSLKTLNQVQNNKEQLQGTFERLAAVTDNYKLKVTLEDYLYKMDNGFGGFLADTAANIYSVYGKNTVQTAVNDEIKKSAKTLVAGENSIYTEQVIDKALAKANYVLIAADAGGMFSEKISGTQTYLEKAVEAKYLWNIENESKKLLRIDLSIYEGDPTDDNAAAVLNDLFWIKALRLREITVTKELYNANGGGWLALADTSLSDVSDAIDEIFESQRDALISASLTETKYTSEPLTLENGETYTVLDFNSETGNNGALKTSGGTKTLKDADARLAGGVTVKKGAALSIGAPNTTIYIPFITMESGASLVITGGRVVIGEFTQNGGSVVFAGGEVDIQSDVKFDNTVALENATLNVTGNVNQTRGSLNIGIGILKIGGDYIGTGGTFDVGSGRVEINGSFLVGTSSYASTSLKMQNESAYMLVNNDFFIYSIGGSGDSEFLTAGTLEVKGDFTCKTTGSSSQTGVTSFATSGTHKVILSGSDEQNISFSENAFKYNRFNILESYNPKVNIINPTIINSVADNSVFNNVKFDTVGFSDDAKVTINGNLYFDGTAYLNNATLNVGGNTTIENYGIVKLGNGTLNISGNMYLSSSWSSVSGSYYSENCGIHLDHGILKIGGDYIGKQGTLDVGNGRLEIMGNYSVGESALASARLLMQNESAYMLVNNDFFIYSSGGSLDGDFLTAGILELKGDFTCKTTGSSSQKGVSSFATSGTHKVILSGSDEQNIFFSENAFKRNMFNILVNKNANAIFKTNYYRYLFYDMPYTLTVVTNTSKGTVNKFYEQGSEVSVTEQLDSLGDLTKDHYTFNGWYTDKELTAAFDESDDALTSDLKLYAGWVPDVYTVTIEANGGTLDAVAVTEYTYGTGAALPAEITKEGYVFGGWYDNAELSGTAVTEISASDYGDKTYYAKWLSVLQTVTENAGAATGDEAENPSRATAFVTNVTNIGESSETFGSIGWKITSSELSGNTGQLGIASITLAPGAEVKIGLLLTDLADETAEAEAVIE